MASDKITQKEVIDQKVIDSFENLNKELEQSIKLMTDLTKAAIDLQKNFNPSDIQQVNAAQKDYNDLAAKSAEENKKAADNLEKLRQRIKEVNEEEERAKIALQEKRKEIKDRINAEKEQKKSTESLVNVLKQQAKTEKEATEQNKKLIAIRKELDITTAKGAKSVDLINKTIDRNNQLIRNNASELGKQKMNIGNYKSVLEGLGSSLGIITGGFALAAAAIRKTISITKQAIDVNREFEKSFANVLTLLDEADKKEFGEILKKGAVDLMADYGLKIEDVNKALFDAISAGVPAANAIDFLRKTSVLATGGVTSLTTAVDGVTSVMNAYGLSASETEKVTSAFFTAQKFGKTTVEELSTNIGKVAPIAKQAGVGYGELLSAMAELTKQGISTDEATTALKATITAIISPNVKAKKTFDKLGIATGATAVKQEGLFNILTQVSKAAQSDSDVLSELIPNVRALTGVGALGAEQLAEYDEILKQVNVDYGEGSSLQKAFNEQLKTGANQTEALKGSWQRLLITIGGGESIFKKIGTTIRTELSDYINDLTKKIEAFKIVWSRLTGELTKEEYRTALIENEKRFSGFAETSTSSADIIIENEQKITEQLKNELQQRISDKKSEKEQLIKIRESFDEDILSLLEEEAENELEALNEKLTAENELILGKEEEKFQTVEELRKKDIENQIEADKKKQESYRQWISFSVQQAQQLSNSIIGYLNSELDYQLQADIEKARSRGASEEEIAQIEKSAAQKRKNIRYVQAIINTALGVTNALATASSWIEGVIAAVLVGALGAIEIATISSASFAKGTKDSGSKWLNATVGEVGTERINFADGTSMYTPSSATKMLLPPHSEVVPNIQLQRELAELQSYGIRNKENDNTQNKEDFKELVRAIKKRDETYINITESGVSVTAKRGNDFYKYIGRKYRGSKI